MRHLLPVLALALSSLTFAPLPATAAPHEFHTCPDEARSLVGYGGDPSWIATNQSSRIQSARIDRVGPNLALVCVYRMFGGDYWIYKRPSRDFPNCTVRSSAVEGYGFYCVS
jgi:hypothetical protein